MTPDGTNPHPEHHYTHGESRNTRREARELALRMLFQLDLGKQPIDEVIEAALGAVPAGRRATASTPKNWCAARWTTWPRLMAASPP